MIQIRHTDPEMTPGLVREMFFNAQRDFLRDFRPVHGYVDGPHTFVFTDGKGRTIKLTTIEGES